MGSSLALFLARRGIPVTLFDAAPQPMSCASRWNEGKIHLGFIYSGDPSLKTARQVLGGGLSFKPVLETLTGCSLGPVATMTDDIYLCHRRTVVQPDAMEDYFYRVAHLIHQHPDAGRYFVDVSDCRVGRLDSRELGAITDSPEILAGFRVPERSVSTNWVADRLIDALDSESRIEKCMGVHITAARPVVAGEVDGPWRVESSQGEYGPYDHVINSLWEGRLAIDQTAGLRPAGPWSNRYRLSLFVRTAEPVDLPSAIIATGPFGDIKNYNQRDFYLSWYPSGLRMESSDVTPPSPPSLDDAQQSAIQDDVLRHLEALLPGVAKIRQQSKSVALRGGWVFAAGQGELSNPDSTLHRRSDFGVFRLG
ncbi:MAG: FAD-dependent oxidoreductase, partial [Thiobacillus sp.]|nr:FAD-dependent oxidoreductase [Thiobacillus sp.]